MPTSSWTQDLTAEMREQLDRLHEPLPWISVRKITLLLGIWAILGTTAVAFESWWVRIPC